MKLLSLYALRFGPQRNSRNQAHLKVCQKTFSFGRFHFEVTPRRTSKFLESIQFPNIPHCGPLPHGGQFFKKRTSFLCSHRSSRPPPHLECCRTRYVFRIFTLRSPQRTSKLYESYQFSCIQLHGRTSAIRGSSRNLPGP